MSKPIRTTAYDIGGFFRVEHQGVPGRAMPYEFVRRIGAVTILPIVYDEHGAPQALMIKNERYHYGTSVNLPAGNVDGGLDNPESPADTALRELREETGYGYQDGAKPDVTVFRLRDVSNTIDYPRFFAVVRGATYLGGELNSDHERITLQPIPLQEYVDPLFGLRRGETYPEVNAAFAKAGAELGHEAVMQWLTDPTPQSTANIAQSFNPWLLLEQQADSI